MFIDVIWLHMLFLSVNTVLPFHNQMFNNVIWLHMLFLSVNIDIP